MQVAYKTVSLSNDTQSGSTHKVLNNNKTVCGKEIDGPIWFIDEDKPISCKACKRIYGEFMDILNRVYWMIIAGVNPIEFTIEEMEAMEKKHGKDWMKKFKYDNNWKDYTNYISRKEYEQVS